MSEPCKACGGSGVIFYTAPGRVAPGSTGCAECGGSETMTGMAREKLCAAALAGIPDPEQFMDDVRLLVAEAMEIASCEYLTHESGRCGECDDCRVFRLAAALKGE